MFVDIVQRRRDPVLADLRVAFQREALCQRVAAARVMHEQRIHAALDREDGAAAASVIGNPVFGLAGGVGVEHRRRVVVGQKLHDVLHEVALHRRVGLDHQHVRMERRDQAEFLAVFVLAGWATPKRVRSESCAVKLGGRGLAAGVGVGAGIEYHDLDRRFRYQHPGQGAEADVVGRAVATHADHGGQQRTFFFGEMVPVEAR